MKLQIAQVDREPRSHPLLSGAELLRIDLYPGTYDLCGGVFTAQPEERRGEEHRGGVWKKGVYFELSSVMSDVSRWTIAHGKCMVGPLAGLLLYLPCDAPGMIK